MSVSEDHDKSNYSLISEEMLESTSAPELLSTRTNKPSDILKSSSSSELKTSSMDQSTEKTADLKSSSSNELIKKTKSNGKLFENSINRANAAYQKMQETSPYNQSVENLYMRRSKRVIKGHKRTATHPPPKAVVEENSEADWNDSTKVENTTSKQKGSHSRSHSQPNARPVGKLKYDYPLFDKVRNAKKAAETAMKVCRC